MGFYSSSQARTLLNSSVSVGGIWVDNLFFTETDKVDSFGVTVGPQVNLNYTSPDLILGLTYFGVGQIFPDQTGANRYIQSASTFLDLPFLTKRIKGLEVRLIENITFTPSLDGFGEVDQYWRRPSRIQMAKYSHDCWEFRVSEGTILGWRVLEIKVFRFGGPTR